MKAGLNVRDSFFTGVFFLILTLLLPTSAFSQNLLSWPESIVFDEQNDRYLISNYNTGSIVQIDMEGNQSYFVRNSDAIQGLEIVDDAVYVGCGYGVKGFDLLTGEVVMDVAVPGVQNCNDVTADTSGNLYVSDVYGHMIIKVNIATHDYSIFATENVSYPNGIFFDEENNRILMCSFRYNSPIQAISLEDSAVTTVRETGIDNCDGLTKDNFGNYYVTSWGTYSIYRFNSDFSSSAELMYYSAAGPADIAYNRRDDILAIPLMAGNTYDLVPVSPTSITADGPGVSLPRAYVLAQNFPNPFNPRTMIAFDVPGEPGEKRHVTLTVSDIRGRRVRTLLDSSVESGTHLLVWDGRNNNGEQAASGIYFYTLRSGSYCLTRKMVLLM